MKTIDENPERVKEALEIVNRVCSLGEYDSNVIGMAAEIIAEDVFGMQKVSRGSKDIDGFWVKDGVNRSVQVKAWSERRVVRYKHGTFLRLKEQSLPDDLLLLLIYSSTPGYEVLYNGPANLVGYVESRGTRAIRLDVVRTGDEITQILDRCKI